VAYYFLLLLMVVWVYAGHGVTGVGVASGSAFGVGAGSTISGG
jgi:hypothetical protein